MNDGNESEQPPGASPPALAHWEQERLVRYQAALLDYSTEFLILIGPRGEIITGVGAGLSVLGYGDDERRGRHIAEHLHPDDLAPVLTVIEKARRQEGYRDTVRVRARTVDGSWLWFEATVLAVTDHDVLGSGAVVRVRHLDGPESTSDAVPDEERFFSLAEALPSGILSADARGWVVYANHAAQQILDIPADRILGQGWMEVIDASDLADVMDAAGLVTTTGVPQQATFRIQTGLFQRWASARFVPLGERAQATGWIATVDDITDRRRAESQLAHRATHDALTDLPNRTLLEDRLEQACARLLRDKGSIAVLFVDLDGFKEINDNLGHHVGDAVLREVAGRLRSALRPADTVARLGGDEFVAVCEGLEEDDARLVARRLDEILAVPMVLEGAKVQVRASIGAAATNDGGIDPAELLARADQAMYRTKRAAR